jgi:DNA-binding transcriptional regulator YiaG
MEPTGRLNSWKEIAAYLGVTARTAQRWEKIESLPARRHKHEVLSSVFAYPSELDAWWHSTRFR